MNLRQLRESRGLTQKEVAKLIDTSISYLSALENGKRNPGDKFKERLAKLYKCSVIDIFLAVNSSKRRKSNIVDEKET